MNRRFAFVVICLLMAAAAVALAWWKWYEPVCPSTEPADVMTHHEGRPAAPTPTMAMDAPSGQAASPSAQPGEAASGTGVSETATPAAETPARPAAPVAAPPVLSPDVRAILGMDSQGVDYAARMRAVHGLGRHLPRHEVEALCEFLRRRWPDQGEGMGQLAFNAMKNDVLDALVKQNPFPNGLQAAMLAMYRDRSVDATWRDYVVQYIEAAWDGSLTRAETNEPAMKPSEIKAQWEAALWEAADEVDGTIAGTALIGLQRLIGRGVDRDRVQRRAVEVAGMEGSSPESRTTALQVAAMLGAADVIPAARQAAGEGATLPLRLSGIVALGLVGGAEDRDWLRTVPQDADARIRLAVDAALKKIDLRLGP